MYFNFFDQNLTKSISEWNILLYYNIGISHCTRNYYGSFCSLMQMWLRLYNFTEMVHIVLFIKLLVCWVELNIFQTWNLFNSMFLTSQHQFSGSMEVVRVAIAVAACHHAAAAAAGRLTVIRPPAPLTISSSSENPPRLGENAPKCCVVCTTKTLL